MEEIPAVSRHTHTQAHTREKEREESPRVMTAVIVLENYTARVRAHSILRLERTQITGYPVIMVDVRRRGGGEEEVTTAGGGGHGTASEDEDMAAAITTAK